MSEFSSEIIFKNETFPNEDSSINLNWADDEDPIYSNDIEKKCGEIILLANTKFWIVCTFCDERFRSIVIFRNHIKGIHITDAENFPYTEDENPLDVIINEHQPTIKFETNIRNGNCIDGQINEPINKKNEEYELKDEKVLGDWPNEVHDIAINNQSVIDEIGEIISTQTYKVSEEDIKDEGIQSIDKTVNKQTKTRKNNYIIGEDVQPTSKKIPKKRNRKKKIHSCPMCQHIARDKKSLEGHLQSNHGTGTQHQCDECGKCYRNANNLKAHMVIHSGTRPYKCDFCVSDFSHYTSLKLHRFIHTGERPHKCNQCNKGFVSSSGLKNHLREHTGEQPFVCHFCERAFASKCSYKRHMISHSGRRPHECPECKKAFIHKETLTKHMACHSDEKKFVCDICSKKFTHKKNMVQHTKLHLNIKQYICKICNKDFAQYAGLYSHMKYHKNKE